MKKIVKIAIIIIIGFIDFILSVLVIMLGDWFRDILLKSKKLNKMYDYRAELERERTK